jgi:hypothetical protein
MLEPHNASRAIFAFDTFSGFPEDSISDLDGEDERVTSGYYAVPEGYSSKLARLLEHYASGRIAINLINGDVSKSVPKLVVDQPASQIALAYFDLDLYQPTADVLDAIVSRLMPGSVVVFDEYGFAKLPGETIALRERLRLRFRRLPWTSWLAYGIVG